MLRAYQEYLRRMLLLRRLPPKLSEGIVSGSYLAIHDRAGADISDRSAATIYTRV